MGAVQRQRFMDALTAQNDYTLALLLLLKKHNVPEPTDEVTALKDNVRIKVREAITT